MATTQAKGTPSLNAAESERAFKQVFDFYDADKDGKLSERELWCYFLDAEDSSEVPIAPRREVIVSRNKPKDVLIEEYKTSGHVSKETFVAWWSARDQQAIKRILQSRLGYDANFQLVRPRADASPTIEHLLDRMCQKVEKGTSGRKNYDVFPLHHLFWTLAPMIGCSRIALPAELLARLSKYAWMEGDEVPGADMAAAVAFRDSPTCPEIRSVTDAYAMFSLAATYFRPFYWHLCLPAAPDPAVAVRLDEHLASWVKAHPGEFEDLLLSLVAQAEVRKSPNDPQVPREKRLRVALEETALETGHLDTEITEKSSPCLLRRTWLAMDPAKAASIAHGLMKKSRHGGSRMIALLTSLCERGGEPTLKSFEAWAPPELVDWLRAASTGTALRQVLPGDDEIAAMTPSALAADLAKYLGIDGSKLDAHFAGYSIISSSANPEGIAAVIIRDAQTIQRLQIPGGRFTLARALQAVMRMSEQECEAAGIRVAVSLTSGHHPDVLHPTAGMESYYLKGDHVGGNADYTLVNLKLIKAGEDAQFTKAALARRSATDTHPAIMNFGNMMPYLIRCGCCFEGPGTPYRCDPEKLWTMVRDIAATLPPPAAAPK